MATGTSIVGIQTVLDNVTSQEKLLFINITSQQITPVRTLGYFWLYQIDSVSPFPKFIIKRGLVSSPGLCEQWFLPFISPRVTFRVDIDWDVPGKNWEVLIF